MTERCGDCLGWFVPCNFLFEVFKVLIYFVTPLISESLVVPFFAKSVGKSLDCYNLGTERNVVEILVKVLKNLDGFDTVELRLRLADGGQMRQKFLVLCSWSTRDDEPVELICIDEDRHLEVVIPQGYSDEWL